MAAIYSARAHDALPSAERTGGWTPRTAEQSTWRETGSAQMYSTTSGCLPIPVETVETTSNGRTFAMVSGYQNGCSPRPDRDALVCGMA
eukprot:6685582-Prymnesium_polylepis.1